MATGRPRLSSDDLRRLLIEAGQDILRENGLGTGGEMLTFKRVRGRVEAGTGISVTNASIIGRLWDDQSDYQTDVLIAFAASYSSSEIERTLSELAPVLANVDTRSEDTRRYSLREMCRVASAIHIDSLRRSQDWSMWIAVWAVTSARAASEERNRIEAALRESYLATTDHLEEIYSLILGLLGFRVRAGLTVRQFTIAAEALAEGCLLRDPIDNAHMNDIPQATGPNGESQLWSLVGIAVHALAQQFFEPDPGWSPPERVEDAREGRTSQSGPA